MAICQIRELRARFKARRSAHRSSHPSPVTSSGMFQRGLPRARQFFFLGFVLFLARSTLSFFTVGCSDGDAVSSLPELATATGSGGAAAGTGGNGDTSSTDATMGSGGSSGTTGGDAGNGGALLDGGADEETVVGSGGTAGGTTSADARQEADAVPLPE